MTIGWRSALPRTGLDEASALPLLRLAEKLAFAGERGAATEAYREHLAAFPDDVDALESLAAVLGRMGRAEELDVRRRLAARMSRDLGVAPEHSEAVIAFEMGSRGAGEAPAEAPAAFVTATFDAFAEGFDEELRDRLSYLGPELIAARLERAFGPARAALDICDVGCGTGLLGALLAPHARSLAGVDLSPVAVAAEVERELRAGGIEVARNGTYDLHTSTLAHEFSARFPGRCLCFEVRRDLLVPEFVPFRELTVDVRRVEAMAAPFARAVAAQA